MWVSRRVNILDKNNKRRGYVRLAACFNSPDDVYAFKRDFEGFVTKLTEKLTPLCGSGGLTAEGTVKSASDSATLMEAEKMLKDNLNRIFHGKIYEAFFTKTGIRPLAYVKGGYYFQQVLIGIYKVFSQAILEEFGRQI